MVCRIFGLLLGLSLAFYGYGKGPGTIIILHLENADSTYFALATSELGFLFEDARPDPVDTFYVDLAEPTQFLFIISNDTSKRFTGYLDIGRNEIRLDLQDPRHPEFLNSPINEDFFYWKNKRDSIWDLTFTPEARELIRIHGQPSAEYDSIYSLLYARDKALTRQQYEACLKQPGNFLTLMFIRTELETLLKEPERATCSQTELKTLFGQLDKRFKKYPVYTECLRLFDLDIRKPPTLAPPLFRPQ